MAVYEVRCVRAFTWRSRRGRVRYESGHDRMLSQFVGKEEVWWLFGGCKEGGWSWEGRCSVGGGSLPMKG